MYTKPSSPSIRIVESMETSKPEPMLVVNANVQTLFNAQRTVIMKDPKHPTPHTPIKPRKGRQECHKQPEPRR